MSREKQTELNPSPGRPKGGQGQTQTGSRAPKDISMVLPDLAEFMDLLDELKEANDRAVAIILAAQIEDVLRASVVSRMVSLTEREANLIFGADKPLGSFAAKIKIGFALGVYGCETRADLDTIRTIRNAFAHSKKPVKFDTPQIASECAKLRIIKRMPADYLSGTPWPPDNPRAHQFDAAARILWRNLGRCAVKYKSPPPPRCPCLA